MLKTIALERLEAVLAALLARGPLYAPVRGERSVDFRRIEDPATVTLDFYNTALSPKAVFFPQSEAMIRYRIDRAGTDAEVLPIEGPEMVLFGVRPCDAVSFEIMDRHFLGGGVMDPYWKARRDRTTVIGYAFDPGVPADRADFYGALGIGAADARGSDVLMVASGERLFFQGLTPRGNALLAGIALLEDAAAAEEAAYRVSLRRAAEIETRTLALEDAAVAAKLLSIFDRSVFWEEVAAACIGCGVCTFVCPTCYCFDIADETRFREGVRKRFWDACLFTDFTLEASGHNPRPKVFQRYRQKVCHKYAYHVARYGCISCVGCGRCTRACPVHIDILSVIREALHS